jgi:hypothetical protein
MWDLKKSTMWSVLKLLEIIYTIFVVLMYSEQRYICNCFNPRTFKNTSMGNVVYFYDCALDGYILGHLSNSFASATIMI